MLRSTQENFYDVHRVNILKTLEHRIEVAKAKGEAQLVQKLEAERRYYTG